MKFSCLRHICGAEVKIRAALVCWPRRNPALAGRLAYMPIPPTDSVVGVRAYRDGMCWSGYLDLDEWLAYTAPDVASLASTETERYAIARSLFDASEQPLHIPLHELDYATLRLQDVRICLPSRRRDCMLSLRTPQGWLWLRSFPELDTQIPVKLSEAVREVPLQISWRLGNSKVSCRLVSTLRCGDVILIANKIFELTSIGIAIARFSINQDGEISVKAENMKEYTAAIEQDTAQARGTASVADIPLRLEFILQRRTLTVAELDILYQGQVLQLDSQAEKRVEVMVNGMCFATGELVELNGRLGVELHDVRGTKVPDEVLRVK